MIPILTANTVSDQLLHHQHQNFQTAATVAVLPLPERVGSPGASSFAEPVFVCRARRGTRSIEFYIDGALLLSFSSRRATQFDGMPAESSAATGEWRNGRRAGFRCQCPLRTWGFKSPFAHHGAVQLNAVHQVRLRKCGLTFCFVAVGSAARQNLWLWGHAGSVSRAVRARAMAMNRRTLEITTSATASRCGYRSRTRQLQTPR